MVILNIDFHPMFGTIWVAINPRIVLLIFLLLKKTVVKVPLIPVSLFTCYRTISPLSVISFLISVFEQAPQETDSALSASIGQKDPNKLARDTKNNRLQHLINLKKPLEPGSFYGKGFLVRVTRTKAICYQNTTQIHI